MSESPSIRDLTTQLEHGDASQVPAFFNGKFEEERFKDLDAIRKLNDQDRAEGKTTVTLECDKRLYYNIDTSIKMFDGSFSDWNGGKYLYSDALNLHTLKHTDEADKVPAAREAVDIRKLTDAMEAGDGTAVAKALDGKYMEERAGILQQTEALNAEDRAQHKTGVIIENSEGSSKGGAGTMSVTRELPGAHDFWFGGTNIYSESINLQSGEREVHASVDDRK